LALTALAALLAAALLAALPARILLVLLTRLLLAALLLPTLVLAAALLAALILVRVTHWEILLSRGLIPQSGQSVNVIFVPANRVVPTHLRWFPVPAPRKQNVLN
jgi:hypothetical protein